MMKPAVSLKQSNEELTKILKLKWYQDTHQSRWSEQLPCLNSHLSDEYIWPSIKNIRWCDGSEDHRPPVNGATCRVGEQETLIQMARVLLTLFLLNFPK